LKNGFSKKTGKIQKYDLKIRINIAAESSCRLGSRFFSAAKKDSIAYLQNGHLLEFQKCPKQENHGVFQNRGSKY
jgi:hypothetical protein